MTKLMKQIRGAAQAAEAASVDEGFNAMSWLDLTLEDNPESFDCFFDIGWQELTADEQLERARLIRSVL